MPHGVSLYDEAQIQRRLWTPALEPAGRIAGWWDAGRMDTISASGGAVTQWRDISGNGRHLTAPSTEQPAYGPSRTYGAPIAINFDGVNDHLSVAFGAQAQPLSLICVIRTGTAWTVGGYEHLASFSSVGNGSRAILSLQRPDTGTGAAIYAGSFQQIGNVTLDTDYIIGGVWNGTSSIGTLNGVQTTGLNPSTFGSPDGFQLSDFTSVGGSPSTATVYEALMFFRALSARELRRYEGYIAWKRNRASILPATHLFRNAPPFIGA